MDGAAFRILHNNDALLMDWHGGPTVNLAGQFSAGTWAHVSVTYAGTGDKKFRGYVNGSLVFTTAANAGTQVDANAGQTFFVGGIYGSYFDGSMDSLGFWTRELSAGDVTAIYNSGSGKSYSDLTTAEKVSLVSWYDFATTASLVTDAHGSNTLTNTNSVTCDAGIVAGQCAVGDPVYRWYARNNAAIYAEQTALANRPILRQGANGKYYLEFDGTNDYLAEPGTSNGNLTGDFHLWAIGTITSVSGDRYFISKQKATANYNGYSLARNAGKIATEVSDGTFTSASGATTIGTGGWKRYSATRSGTTGTVYINGTSDGTGTVRGGDTSFAASLNIGRFSGTGGLLVGGIAHVVIQTAEISVAQQALLETYGSAETPT